MELRSVRRLLDTTKGNPERFGDYATLAQEFLMIGASDDSQSTYDKLAADIEHMGGRWQRIKDWFLPLLNERIALTVCGLMALIVFLLRPTVEVWAKALSFRFHGHNADPNIQRALGSNSSPKRSLYLPPT